MAEGLVMTMTAKQVRESFLTTAQLRKYALFWQQALTSD
jgi:hypothetical protein